MVDLQLKKARLDQVAKKDAPPEESAIQGQGMIIDRNELLRSILGKKND